MTKSQWYNHTLADSTLADSQIHWILCQHYWWVIQRFMGHLTQVTCALQQVHFCDDCDVFWCFQVPEMGFGTFYSHMTLGALGASIIYRSLCSLIPAYVRG